MPELPEVETIRRDLNKKIVGKKIVQFEVLRKKVVQAGNDKIEKILTGNSIKNIDRRGKLIIFELASGDFLLIHLKMTGQLLYHFGHHLIVGGHNVPVSVPAKIGRTNEIEEDQLKENLRSSYTAVVFTFADKSQLFFNDMRQFGYVKLVDAMELEKIKSKFGVEPFDKKFTLEKFQDILRNKKSNIKAVLMDQTNIAGIGNIYADEICFCAHVRPDRKVEKLQLEEIKKMFACMPTVLDLAIQHRGTTFSNYVDSEGKKGNFVNFLKVYGREGEKCLHCKVGIIQKTRVAGRGTSFCSECQK